MADQSQNTTMPSLESLWDECGDQTISDEAIIAVTRELERVVDEEDSPRQDVQPAATASGSSSSKRGATCGTSSSISFDVPAKRGKYDLQAKVSTFFSARGIFSELEFMSLVRARDKEAQKVWDSIKNKQSYPKMLDVALRVARAEKGEGTWLERVWAWDGTIDDDRIIQCRDNFMKLFKHQGLSDQEVLLMFSTMAVTDELSTKCRTVYLQGPPSAGKSAITLLLTSVYEKHEIGTFGPQALNSQFWLQDLYGKEVYVGDEAKATPLNIQTYLLLMEGNRDLSTELKYREKVGLLPRPVIISVNRDIWSDCQGYAAACRARMVEIRFMRRSPNGCHLYYPRGILRKALQLLVNHYVRGGSIPQPIGDTTTEQPTLLCDERLERTPPLERQPDVESDTVFVFPETITPK